MRLGNSTSISITNFPKSPVFARQPALVRKGNAAAVAGTTTEALAEHEAARRLNLEMAAVAFDNAH